MRRSSAPGDAMRSRLVALVMFLAFVPGCFLGRSTAGPIPGQDPIVGKWHERRFGTPTFTPDGVFLPDARFGARCRDVPQVTEEKRRCASGSWIKSAEGAYAIVLPNFVSVGPDG